MMRFLVHNSSYLVLSALLLTSVEIMNQGSRITPFQNRTARYAFVMAIIYHAFVAAVKPEISLVADILFHSSGIIAIETLMWILADEWLGFIIINMSLLLVLVSVSPLCYSYIISKVQRTFLSAEERISDQNDPNPSEIQQVGLSDDQIDLEAQKVGLSADDKLEDSQVLHDAMPFDDSI